MVKTAEAKTETKTHRFETEVQQLLQLMIHSLYSHKEIFLRELISNASDACDKLRFSALTDSSLLEDDGELEIQVDFNNNKHTITVRDNGIGMDRDEVIENIGTIARSGTKQFVQALSGDQTADANLIGQFGVGFYSAFMIAEHVTLTTRKAGTDKTEGVRWQSDGSGEYTLETLERPQRGTEVILKLRKEESEYLDPHRLRSIIAKYSDHISLPIKMREMDGDKKKDSWEIVNKGSALWARAKNEIAEEEYNNFYNTLSYDGEPPFATLHNKVEGKLEYISLFFIPARAPFDLWDRERRHGVKLYVRRVFIADDAENLMPAYLRFVRGIVDSADLPLNVSREFLQHNKEIDKIKSASVKKILGELGRIADKEPEKYQQFWDQFGQVMKEGMVEDQDNHETLINLLRFASTRGEGDKQTVSLKQYLKRMPEEQKAIYVITGENYSAVKDSPHLEVFRKNDIEVLLLTDPVDEWVLAQLTEFEGKPVKSVAKGALEKDELPQTDKGAQEQAAQDKRYDDLLTKFKELLKDQVKDVRLTHRLTDSPACLVADEHDLGANLERILKSMGQDAPQHKPILELNPDHPMISVLKPDADDIGDWALVLFDQAALSEGAQLKEPVGYVKRVNKLLAAYAGGEKSSIIMTP